jgi:hypothetical protein
MRILVFVLIVLAPVSAIAAAMYEIATGKQDPALYLLLAVIPGALVGALKELKDSGWLPPSRLRFMVDSTHTSVKSWMRKNGEDVQQITGIVVPVRIENSDSSRAIDILDVSVTSLDSHVVFHRPEIREVKIGSEQKWIYTIADGGWSELLNDGKQKMVESKKIMDYVIAVCEHGTTLDKYTIRITFRDNWKRNYSQVIVIDVT